MTVSTRKFMFQGFDLELFFIADFFHCVIWSASLKLFFLFFLKSKIFVKSLNSTGNSKNVFFQGLQILLCHIFSRLSLIVPTTTKSVSL